MLKIPHQLQNELCHLLDLAILRVRSDRIKKGELSFHGGSGTESISIVDPATSDAAVLELQFRCCRSIEFH